MKNRKIVIIGIDGADPFLTKMLLERGLLPNLAKMADDGIFLPLASTIPWHSGPAWTAFGTGTNPGGSGIFSFFKPISNYAQEPATADDVPLPFFWEIAGAAGARCGMINVPMTSPPRPVNGFVLSGYPCREINESYPEDFYKKFHEMMLTDFPVPSGFEHVNEYARATLQKDAAFITKAPLLMRDNDINVLGVVVEILDRVQHFYWHEMDAGHPAHNPKSPDSIKTIIPATYRMADSMVGYIMKEVGEDADYFVCSDHGFTGTSLIFNLGKFLQDTGYTVFREGETLETIREDGKMNVARLVDVSRSKVYPSHMSLISASGLSLNIAGREPGGIVPPEEADKLKEELKRELKDLKFPGTDEKIFTNVYSREEIYSGKMADKGPDLLVTGKHVVVYFPFEGGMFAGVTPLEPGAHRPLYTQTGVHGRHGIFLASGPSVDHGAVMNREAYIADIAPTVLHMLGLSAPAHMDGRVLPVLKKEILEMETSPAPEIQVAGPGAAMSKSDMEKTMEHLKGMGYI